MSYDFVRNIKLDKKNNIIEIECASNNVIPLLWNKYNYLNSENDKYRDLSFEDKLLILYSDFQKGFLVINTINKNTENFQYALIKAEEFNRQKESKQYDYVSYSTIEDLEKFKNVYGDSFLEFKKALYEKMQGDYILYNGAYYMTKLGNYGGRFGGYQRYWYGFDCKDRALKMSYKKAYIVKNNFEKAGFEIQKV